MKTLKVSIPVNLDGILLGTVHLEYSQRELLHYSISSSPESKQCMKQEEMQSLLHIIIGDADEVSRPDYEEIKRMTDKMMRKMREDIENGR
jgi:hypothetical protein